ncbi:NF-X1-type zinc finger protein nfxl1 [Dionaea muscipula]
MRGNRSRFTAQNGRQEWVPRGSSIANPSSGGGDLNVSSVPENAITEHFATVDSASHVNPYSNLNGNGSGSDLNESSMQSSDRHRGGFNAGSHVGRPPNHRRGRGGGRLASDSDKGCELGKGLKASDSNLPQLMQEIQEKLMKGTVECMICYDMVRRTAPIWSCSSCYSIFHLHCAKKWARAPTSVDLSAEKNHGFNWRCPGCQSVQLTTSKEIRYVCFCGKRQDPPSDLYLTPHSCGEPCRKPLDKEIPGDSSGKEYLCPHVCVLQCHPGPCPPCKAFAPPQFCPCGKKEITTRCSDRKSVLTCGQHCGKMLPCGRHRCQKICHVGPCEPCTILISASCFCKKTTEFIPCRDLMVKGEVKVENGLFSCSSSCDKKLRCGNHSCIDLCHPGPCEECKSLPSKIKTCHCGKTFLQEPRKSCLEPIPTCSLICEKLLSCGVHQCKEVCHAGDCPPCLELVSQKCRCRSTSRITECYRTTSDDEKFVCEKPCGQKKNCRRHRCSERCCPLSNSSSTPTGDWDTHFCSMPCGKKLRCGQHSCLSLCHSGHCPPCLETIFTDLTCACGRTSILPPLPCGTPPPSCHYPCSIPQPCGHQSSHICHFGDCPPCSVSVAKECVGGHVVIRNIPCGSKDIRCIKLCGKTRQCGLHACARTCHPPPCDIPCVPSDFGLRVSCGQSCGAPRRDCRHTCTAPCHPSAACPDLRCEFPVTITCSCGRITATVPCGAGGSSSDFNVDNVRDASIIQRLPVALQPVEANDKKIPLGQRKLVCDGECAKLERKRVLADAFDITPPSLDALHFGDNPAVSEVLSDMLRRDAKWVLSVEERCKFLVLGKSRGSTSSLKVHVFCPMVKDKRDAVRIIADRWKLCVSAAGWEPKRFVVIHVTSKSRAPSRILGPKGAPAVSFYHSPVFDPLVDMEPRLVVALLDLPSDTGISQLILRFGGECELVWLNDKNALAVFSDPARAATAMRRLDHGSVYHGAAVVQQAVSTAGAAGPSSANAWAGLGTATATSTRSNPWKKAVVKDADWTADSWAAEEWADGSADVQASSWKPPEAPIAASVNRWNILDSDSSGISSVPSSIGQGVSSRPMDGKFITGTGTSSVGSLTNENPTSEGNSNSEDVVDNWEEAYE